MALPKRACIHLNALELQNQWQRGLHKRCGLTAVEPLFSLVQVLHGHEHALHWCIRQPVALDDRACKPDGVDKCPHLIGAVHGELGWGDGVMVLWVLCCVVCDVGVVSVVGAG